MSAIRRGKGSKIGQTLSKVSIKKSADMGKGGVKNPDVVYGSSPRYFPNKSTCYLNSLLVFSMHHWTSDTH